MTKKTTHAEQKQQNNYSRGRNEPVQQTARRQHTTEVFSAPHQRRQNGASDQSPGTGIRTHPRYQFGKGQNNVAAQADVARDACTKQTKWSAHITHATITQFNSSDTPEQDQNE